MKREAEFDFTELISGENTEFIVGASTTPTETESTTKPTSKNGIEFFEDTGDTKKEIEFIVGKKVEDTEEIIDDEEDNEEEKKHTPSSKDTEDASDSFALAFAKFQQEEGVISELDEEEFNKILEEHGEVGALKYLLDLQRESIYEEAKATYSADQEELKEYFELKDNGVDIETARDLAFNKKQLTGITEDKLEEDENLRKTILTQHYKMTTAFTDKKISKLVEQSIQYGDDIEESKEALAELQELNKKQIEEAKLQVKQLEDNRLKQVKEYQEDFKKFVYEKDEFFKDSKINKQTKDKIIDMVLKPATKDVNGNPINAVWAERAKDPKKFDAYLAAHLLNGTFYGDLSKVKTKAKTAAVTELERQLEHKSNKLGGKTVSKTTDMGAIEEFLRFK